MRHPLQNAISVKFFDYFPFIFKYHFQHLITKLEFRKSNNYKLNFGKDVIKKIL